MKPTRLSMFGNRESVLMKNELPKAQKEHSCMSAMESYIGDHGLMREREGRREGGRKARRERKRGIERERESE